MWCPQEIRSWLDCLIAFFLCYKVDSYPRKRNEDVDDSDYDELERGYTYQRQKANRGHLYQVIKGKSVLYEDHSRYRGASSSLPRPHNEDQSNHRHNNLPHHSQSGQSATQHHHHHYQHHQQQQQIAYSYNNTPSSIQQQQSQQTQPQQRRPSIGGGGGSPAETRNRKHYQHHPTPLQPSQHHVAVNNINSSATTALGTVAKPAAAISYQQQQHPSPHRDHSQSVQQQQQQYSTSSSSISSSSTATAHHPYIAQQQPLQQQQHHHPHQQHQQQHPSGLKYSQPIVALNRFHLLSSEQPHHPYPTPSISSAIHPIQQPSVLSSIKQQSSIQPHHHHPHHPISPLPTILSPSPSLPSLLPTRPTAVTHHPAVVRPTAAAPALQQQYQYQQLMSHHIPSAEIFLQEMIGGGAFGSVWRGLWHASGGTPIAIKLLSPACQGATAFSEKLLTAFEEEASILARLRHPNICLFLGVCLEPQHRMIITELVSRGSLWEVLRRHTSFAQGNDQAHSMQDSQAASSSSFYWPNWVIRRVLEGAGRGLIYLHHHSPPIIHRDLKSANLLLDDSFHVKICDFGLARLRDLTAVLTANVGTVQWMAPEVLVGGSYDESVDVYSMALVAWEMLTGQCPYEGMQQVEVALAVVNARIRPTLPPQCTRTQREFLQRCWSTHPHERPTANDFVDEVGRIF